MFVSACDQNVAVNGFPVHSSFSPWSGFWTVLVELLVRLLVAFPTAA
jgi:hypothetical protein